MSNISGVVNNPFPILRDKLNLGEYHPNLEGNFVEVWINPSEDFRTRWYKFNDDVKELATNNPESSLTEGMLQTRAELWSELWNISIEEARKLLDTDDATGLITWMRVETWERIGKRAAGEAPSG